MSLLAGPYLIAVVILGAAGALKVARPATTARALGEMGLPVPPAAVRAAALGELAIAAGALVGGGRPLAALVAASYAGFAGFVAVALGRGTPLSSCGCFGVDDTPPTGVHAGLNLAAAAVAAGVAVTGSGAGGLAEIAALEGQALLGVAFVAATATSVWLAVVALTALPRLRVRRP